MPQVSRKIFTKRWSASPIKRRSRLTWSETSAFIGYITMVRIPRMDQLAGLFFASVANFAINGHMKHSVLPEPVPVDTNRSWPSNAASKADT